MKKWTRRAFLAAGGVIGGGMMLGIGGVLLAPNRMDAELPDGQAYITTWIKILPDNTVVVMVPHCEMGQGVHTATAMMLAEELDADWDRVRITEAPAESEFANEALIRFVLDPQAELPTALTKAFRYYSFRLMRVMTIMVTGGSSAVRLTGQHTMRKAGAAARMMLIQAASERWSVPIAECEARSSHVYHAASGRQATYGELADAAADLPAPVDPPLKSRSEFNIIGKSLPRYDIPPKVDGTTTYGFDMQLPGMLHAAVIANPIRGGGLVSVDTAPAKNSPGVVGVVEIEDAVAVVADSTWRAQQGAKLLFPQFGDLGESATTSASLHDRAREALRKGGTSAHSEGDAEAAWKRVEKVVEADYEVPFLAHATMEPMACTAQFKDSKLEIWAGTQDPLNARHDAAIALGLEWDNVKLHNLMLGGGFGRRLPERFDYVVQGAHIAKAMEPHPVKLTWSREEDTQHDFYRPAVWTSLKGGLNAQGELEVWSGNFTYQPNKPDILGAYKLPYSVPNQSILSTEFPHHVPVGDWRSVEHSWHGYFVECFVDELAHAAGADPYLFRRKLLAHNDRFRAVLDEAATKAGWDRPPPAGRARGIAIVGSFKSVVAQVVEISVSADKVIKIHKIVAAVDCGYPINPDGARAQVEGGILFGLSAALLSEITIQRGRVAQSNFRDYEVVHMADTPEIEVHFVDTGAPLGGLGEPGVPPVAPAIANALFAATGQRLRSLPLKKHGYKVR